MLLPARTDTKWFHEFIYHKHEIRFIKGRLKFNDGKNNAPFPSMLVIMKQVVKIAKGQIKQAQIKIDKDQFEKLCGLQCTETEIIGYFGISKDTLIRWCKETYNMDFANIYEQKKGTGKIALRRFQMQQAEKNPTMAIWLGKQYLNQTDKIETNNEIKLPVFNIEVTDNKELEKEFEKYETDTETNQVIKKDNRAKLK